MKLYIGDHIKRLRKQKGITQETLAEQMHVSTAAVSKWERNETLPDIGMVIPLASYFGVSTDEILGVDAVKNEEKIKLYLEESSHLAALGKTYERFALIQKAYEEFPNDWRIIEAYIWQLNYDPNCTDPWGNEVHKDELYRLCERVLDECNIDSVRYSALSVLGGLYVLDGDMEKAKETAARFPSYWRTKGEELAGCVSDDNTAWLAQERENLWEVAMLLQVKMRNIALHDETLDAQKKITYLKKAVELIDLVFADGDYGFFHHELSDLYLWIANRYVMIDDFDNAFSYYELGFRHARAYDTLPKQIKYTSVFVKDVVFDMANIDSNTEANMVANQLERLRSWGVYEKVKDMPQMKAILAKYEPFAGQKKDYH